MTGGFEQASYVGPGGFWRLSADISGLPEGLHTVKTRLFNTRAAGLPAIYQTFTRTVYIDLNAAGLRPSRSTSPPRSPRRPQPSGVRGG